MLLGSFLVAFAVAVLRGYALGDLPPGQVLRSSALWGVSTFLLLGFASYSLVQMLKSPVASRRGKGGRPSWKKRASPTLPPEVLNQAEDEVPLLDRPKPPQVEGTPPEELAEALRSVMKDGRA